MLMTDSTKFYEVIPGLLYAGECPWVMPLESSHMNDLLELGIRDFITLRDDVNSTQISAITHALHSDISVLQFPIRDFSVPEHTLLEQIVDILGEHITSHRITYVSCAKGLGRTGLVIGCFLADYYRISNEQALKLMNELRLHCNFQNEYDSPETQEQINFVMNRNTEYLHDI